ncbi:MAG: DNA polymerase domain-containing protein, partial [Planktothrix sp.]
GTLKPRGETGSPIKKETNGTLKPRGETETSEAPETPVTIISIIDILSLLEVQIIVLDKRQLAIKVSANSFFGLLGVQKNGKLPLIEGAMSITAIGRMLNAQVQKFIEEKYGAKEIYADTDSNMIWMSDLVKDNADCVYWGERLAEEINGIKKGELSYNGEIVTEDRPGLFKAPLKLEFEKAMDIICFTKKKYSALLINKDGEYSKDKEGKIIILEKGNIIARRGNPEWLRQTYFHTRNCALIDHAPFITAFKMLVQSIKDIYAGKVGKEKLVITRELGSNYKQENFFMKVFSDRLAQMGKPQRPGDRLEFVVCDIEGDYLGEKLFLLEDALDPNFPHKIDYNYYVEKALQNPLTQ